MAAEEVGDAAQQSSESTEQIEAPGFLLELFSSPLNIALLAICFYLLYQILARNKPVEAPPRPPELPRLRKRDFTMDELREYSGGENTEGRILVAVNSKVFDVTRGKKFYGPEKYDYIGKLLKPGEEPSEYSDEEHSEASEAEKKEN
ncbi:membrane-associated progesterone receptor component 1-like [Saccoglossus kowalevskii]|uniref:Membrane-associated progesterone receptor component 1-like n=1 Tax=Saccoglossus kowalevskii TaxID=10224 RepID=A0ABM0MAC8_SACKO|nr:PREDICTED: membrane-associated progesterone receptor component 1-like [Saccoglossus kowalevskii]